MKKTLLSLGLMLTLCAGGALAQSDAPSCSNDNGLEGRIGAIEAGGWVELSREFVYINYFVEPTPPYTIGYLTVIFGVDCQDGEGCPQIAKAYQEVATQINQHNCVWQKSNQIF